MSAVCQGSFTTTRLLAMTKTMAVELLERQQNRPKTIKELQMQWNQAETNRDLVGGWLDREFRAKGGNSDMVIGG